MNNSTFVYWGSNHLKAMVLAQFSTEAALRVSLRKNLGEKIDDESINLMNQQVQSTISMAEKTIRGKQLDVLLQVKNLSTGKEEIIRAKYDKIEEDRKKLISHNRELVGWFPSNFKSLVEWLNYTRETKEIFKQRFKTVAA